MSITDTAIIDIVGVDRESGKVILTIADHLEWADEYDHLTLLQAKLNTYVEFIQSGEMTEAYPSSRGREPAIEIVFKYTPRESGRKFIEAAANALSALGIEVRSEVKF